MSSCFRYFLSSNGISNQISCPHTSEQNGVAKRKHRHVVETSLTLLAHSHMPLAYWPDAFNFAIFLINRMPTRALSNVSPLGNPFSKTTRLLIFTCIWVCLLPMLRPYTRNKLEFRSTKCVFIGYNLNHKGYCCLDPCTGRVFLSRNVVFDETSFPLQH